MDYPTANALLKEIHLRKDWHLTWRRTFANHIMVEIIGAVDDSSGFPDYAIKATAHAMFMVDLDKVGGPLELTRVILDGLVEMAIHEEREFLRLGPKGIAPFHPHTPVGERNYQSVTSYRTKDKFVPVTSG
jgi:hypothetical protein